MAQKNDLGSFALKFVIFGLIAGFAGLIVFVLLGIVEKIMVLLLAWILSFLVIFSGYLANRWAFARSHKVFLSVLLGGMTLRIVVLIGLILLIYVKGWVPISWFLILLAIYYFTFQIVEITVINRQLKSKIRQA